MTTAAVIVAAGRGTRAGGGLPKQWRPLAGRRVADWTLAAFAAAGVDRIVVVLHPDDRAIPLPEGVIRVTGGATRDASVRAGLEALAETPPDKVLIHDIARPCVTAELISSVVDALDGTEAAAPGLPVSDALWRGADGHVAGTQDRDGLFRAQTPQGFRFGTILDAHRAHMGGAADDVEVTRAAGIAVQMVPGDPDNIKITAPADFARAERILRGSKMTGATRVPVRLGNGYDVHAFGPGDHVMLCGVRVDHGHGLVGHSDADVGMHAITDAIYGALAEGDIGRHFPPSDPQWKGAASGIFLAHAGALARSKGYEIGNIDCTLVCERPKIGPHALTMQAELARILGTPADRISVKATTSERLGFTGREEGIAALATATLFATGDSQ
ncbi:2-C-methyl-D-erythritol 2,4-cyclodiphosphate synthase [Oceanicola sp. 22II-s10i]|uniref:bifunctional 2-C-methyl-D-erythritol 4-phosphate cytidylyltransferase/2-C-methyl-D-erythritol 2,4-cyclodiphosphate synthase n=1 Tax=Oceanicola sp. 22II-s10i TaxID=1317116 RepID=UPI000B522E36|nr:bifunctional 2-C-methyl-D-erythritol 4-phosphate cytidylyltransferase/2-C-methyl-D-erythritol 2,4-cyclodiphosphate synthase [Oceanicola sp. 22II-s10i]OWU84877.1 2-C-methyl-D-erythritol 2,4-cyclodiphosphate synthase [Oceanicola sp. 22II-s10i]